MGIPADGPAPGAPAAGPVRGEALAFAAAFAAFTWTGAPGLGWQDSGELAVGAWSLGIAHPPGEPTWLLAGRLAQAVPVGDVAWRLVLLSAGTAAAAVALAYRLGAAESQGGRGVRAASGALAAALAAAGLWLQAVRVELYGLQAALLLGTLACARTHARGRGGGAAGLGGLLFGLGLGNHHALAIAATPGLALAAARRGGLRGLGPALAGVVLGVSVYAFLPIRAGRSPVLMWDDPSHLVGFLRVASAAEYRRSFAPTDPSVLVSNAVLHAEALVATAGWAGLALAAVGALSWARRDPRWAWGWAGIVGGALSTTLVQGVYDVANPDAAGYHAPAFVLIGVAAASGLGAALAALPGAAPRGLAAAVALAALAVLPGAASRADQRGAYGARHMGRVVLDSIPPAGSLVGAGDSWTLPALYLAAVEGWRGDVHLQRLSRPGVPPVGGVRLVPGPWPFTLREAGVLSERAGGEAGTRAAGSPDADLLLARWVPTLLADPWSSEERAARVFLAAVARGRAAALLSRGQARRASAVLAEAAATDPEPWRMLHLEAFVVRGRRDELEAQAAVAEPGTAALARLRLGDDTAWGTLLEIGDAEARTEAAVSAGWLPAAMEAAAALPPRSPARLFAEGRVLLDRGRPREAVPPLAALVQARPGDPEALDWLARALLAAGDPAAAAEAWGRLLGARPGWPQALLGLDRLKSHGIGSPSR
ncbi:DUF2723 domain-containing protein [Myxococcota bacterium]|nr:DUF2723 domain-containing protein [Myxococcota bacterium]